MKKNIKEILELQIPQKAINTFLLVAIVIMGSFLFVWNAEAIAFTENANIVGFVEFCNEGSFWRAYVTLALIWGALYALFGNLFVSFCIMEVGSFVWGIANRATYVARKQFISVDDLKLWKEVTGVKVDLGTLFDPISFVLLIIGIVLMIVLYVVYCKEMKMPHKSTKKQIITRVATIPLLMMFYVYLYVINPSDALLHEISPYMQTGSVVWFHNGVFNNVGNEVSLEEVEEIYAEFEALGKTEEMGGSVVEYPNIIVIMSEAFWNLNYVSGKIDMSENPMESYSKLASQAISGEVAVNIYGGGTVTSEFEFLTGLNAKNFTKVRAFYSELYTRPQDSMVSYMENLGYYTMALHPYQADFWERDVAYSSMGFDRYYSDVDFENRELYHGYISDKSLSKEIIQRMNEQKAKNPEQPVFTFAVSVQNHTYDMEEHNALDAAEDEYEIEISFKEDVAEGVQKDWVEYINGVKESVEALEELMTYYENCDEETVIVFFGDHAPSLAGGLYEKTTEVSLYRTPYLIWSNYENDFQSYGDVNLSYLSSILIEYLELPKPRQYYVNKYMMEIYSVDTSYDVCQVKEGDKGKMQGIISAAHYIYHNFKKEDFALDFW